MNQPKIPTLAKSGMLYLANLIKHKRRFQRIKCLKPEYIVIHIKPNDH